MSVQCTWTYPNPAGRRACRARRHGVGGDRRHQGRGRGHGQEGGRRHQVRRARQGLCRDQTIRTGPFVDRDLYIVVYGLDGMVLAHGADAKRIGTNQMNDKDADGKEFVKERIELAKTHDELLAELQIHEPGDQEGRAEADVLRAAGADCRLRRRLSVLTDCVAKQPRQRRPSHVVVPSRGHDDGELARDCPQP